MGHVPESLVKQQPDAPETTARGGKDSTLAWTVIGALTVILTIASGSRFLFGVVLKPVSEEYGWDRAALSGAVLAGMVILSICQPIAGLMIDRHGPRKVVTVGLLFLAAGMFLLSRADTLLEFYLYFGVMTSIGLAATGPVIATSVVSRWFARKRAVAMSIATSGAAFGQLMIVPIAAEILVRTNWHTEYWVFGIVLLAITLPLAIFVLRDGPKGTVSAAKSADAVGLRLPDALRGPLFWLLAVGFIVCGWTMAYPNVHFIAHADDMGMSHTMASLTVSVTAMCSIAGSILLGMAADRHRRSSVLALVYALRGLAFVLLALLPVGNLVFVYAVVLGISWSATTPLTAAIAADRYGAKHFGIIFGSMFTFMNIGFGLGAWADGVIYDATGSYDTARWVNVAMGVIATVAILAVDRMQTSRPRPTSIAPAGAAAD